MLCNTVHVKTLLRLMRHPCTCALTKGFQQPVCSAPSVFHAKNRRSEIAVTFKMKLKRHILREFTGYWWLFWTQHLMCYSARLFEEERRIERRTWTILIFDCFRFATLKQLLHIAIITADWGRLYNLLDVLLDASINFVLWWWYCHENQCISVYTVMLSLGNKCYSLKALKAAYICCPSLQ